MATPCVKGLGYVKSLCQGVLCELSEMEVLTKCTAKEYNGCAN